MTVLLETRPPHSVLIRERKRVRAFPDSEAAHKFLGTGDNSLHWREHVLGLKPGTYAYAGGKWHNVKSLDASVLAHI